MDGNPMVSFVIKGDLDGLKNCILNDCGVSKFFPGFLKLVLDEDFINFNENILPDVRDNIILYLIEEETKARCSKNKWNYGEWNLCIRSALENCFGEKVVFELINTGRSYIDQFSIFPSSLSVAIKNNFSVVLLSTLLKYCHDIPDNDPFFFDKLLSDAVLYDRGVDFIKLLVDHGSDLHFDNFGVGNLLHNVHLRCNGNNCDSKQTVDYLMKSGLDIKHVSSESNTVIHNSNCHYLIHLAIKHGVSIEQRGSEDFTPLMGAVLQENLYKVNALLEFGADPNSALIFYFHWFYSEVKELFEVLSGLVDLLLYHGANYLAKIVQNVSPLDVISDFYPCALKKIVRYYLFFVDESELPSYFLERGDSKIQSMYIFIRKCKIEQDKMKNIYLDGVSLYNFCRLKKFYKSESVNISFGKSNLNKEKIIKMFPIYHEFIMIRIKDNIRKRRKKVLCNILENVVVESINNTDDIPQPLESNVLNYDSLYYLSKYLHSKHVYNLFLASIKN